MKKFKVKNKRDDKLIIVLAAIIVASVVISFLIPKDNSNVGYQIKDLPETFDNDFSKLIISELVSNNDGVYVDSHNEACDFIELFNGTDNDIDLNGYGLTDDGTQVKWVFKEQIIRSGEYLVLNLNDKIEDPLDVNFKLSSSGKEKVLLLNNSNKVIDGVETVSLAKNQSMVRDNDGKWYISNFVTPGYPNSLEGRNSYLASLQTNEESELVINELLVKNKGNFINEYDDLCGFIEVKNISDHSINLADYTLSNSYDACFKKKLDNVTLLSGECYFYYLGDKNTGNNDYLGFDFSNNEGVAVLAKNGKIVNVCEYSNLVNGYSLQYENGNYSQNAVCSIGYDNDAKGIENSQRRYLAMAEDLVISEVMNNNKEYLAVNGGKYYDWIELYNNSNETINLADYYLSTSANNLYAYNFKDVSLAPGNYYLVMCSGDTNLSTESYQHTNFKLSDVESVYLSKGKKIIDSVFIADVPFGYSYGRNSDYGFSYMSTVTPLEKNKDGIRSISSEPVIALDGGIYNDVTSLTIEINGPKTIYYTLDGSTPTTSSKIYTGPFSLDETTVVKARSFEDGKRGSSLVCESYIINENHNMPVMSVSLNPEDFSYVKANAWVTGLEKQAYVEFYEEDNSFSLPCSYSLFGGNARSYAKKSFCLRFDKEWGASSLNYPLFDNRDFSYYDAIVLRTGSSDWSKSIIRDVLGTSLVDEGTDLDVQAYKPCIVYINGQYYGIFNIREKVGATFISTHYNIPEENINIIRAADSDVTCGSKRDYDNLREYCRSHDLSNDEYYKHVLEHIDVVNFADYWVAEGFVTNNDLLNVRLFMSPDLDGKWRYIFYDLDYAYYRASANWYTEYIGHPGGYTNHLYENDIIYALLKNKDFQELFVERLAYALQNYYSKDSFYNRMDEIVNYYDSEIERDHKRWSLPMDDYYNSLEDVKKFISNRYDYYLRQTQSYFGLSNERMKDLFGDLWK